MPGYVRRESGVGGPALGISAAQLDIQILYVLLRGVGIIVNLLFFKHDVLQNVIGL